jgi:rubrerythrin
MNSSVERKKVRRYRDLLRTTSDDMMRNQLCRLIAEQERRHLLQQVLDQQHPADEAETV